jgi:thiol:disulfide interchange protein
MLHVATLALVFVLNGSGLASDGDSGKPLVVAGEPEQLTYEAAYRKAQEEKKPLVVLVGADWCPACKTMKSDTIATMKQSGELKEVVYTQLDKDANPELADQVMQGKMLPQLVVFCESDSGWKRFSLTGMQTQRRVKDLIRKASEVLPHRR